MNQEQSFPGLGIRHDNRDPNSSLAHQRLLGHNLTHIPLSFDLLFRLNFPNL